jgi:HD-GYP domain-containing protein (c-di-GMP phosphodiesterase class II)/pSer/pThr/pTyr-binding forkhead associated (FHA) protein
LGKQLIQLRRPVPDGPALEWEADQILRVGRIASLEVILDDVSVSRRHAEVVHTEQGWVVRDLGSTNGTFVNGVRVGRADQRLRAGDILQIGNVKLNVTIPESTAKEADSESDAQVQAALCNSWSKVMLGTTPGAIQQAASNEQMLALLRIGRDFSTNTSPDEFLNNLVRDAVVALRGFRGALLLTDSNGKLFPRAVWGGPTTRSGVSWIDLRLAERAFLQGQSLLCQEAQENWVVAPSGRSEPPASSVVCGLLRSPRSRLGILYLDRGLQQPAFTRDELHLTDVLAVSVAGTVEGVQYFADRENGLFVQTLTALAQAVELRDDYTGSHTQRVTDYALLLADEVKLGPMEHMYLQVGTPLHDIGKIGISDAILLKSGRLTEEEYTYMKSHTWKGAAILEIIPHLAPILPIVRNHHEHWDGNGYPDRLSGEDIPVLGRIVAVADAFDAMTSDRPYRPGMPSDRAFFEIQRKRGVQFDPEFAEAFLRVRPRIEDLMGQQRQLMETASREEVQRVLGNLSLMGPPGTTFNRRTAAVPRLTPEAMKNLLIARQKEATG